MIEAEIKRVVEALELDRFPTHSEIEKFFGNKALTNKISKTGGTKHWAKVLGYGVKNCESEFGDRFERHAMHDIFNNVGLKSFKNKVGYPYDLATNSHIKVDVKSSTINERNDCSYFSFNLEKRFPTCDIFILYFINNADEICKTYIIPSCHVCGQTQIGITAYGKSKWDSYKDKWDIFHIYNEFYQILMSQKTNKGEP